MSKKLEEMNSKVKQLLATASVIDSKTISCSCGRKPILLQKEYYLKRFEDHLNRYKCNEGKKTVSVVSFFKSNSTVPSLNNNPLVQKSCWGLQPRHDPRIETIISESLVELQGKTRMDKIILEHTGKKCELKELSRGDQKIVKQLQFESFTWRIDHERHAIFHRECKNTVSIQFSHDHRKTSVYQFDNDG